MDYNNLSNFEINKAVADALLIAWHCRPALSVSGTWEFSDNYERYGKGGKAVDLPDYCNNPTDAWPVIVDNGITMINEGKEWSALANASVSSGWDVSFDHVCWHTNPLRAAMIVFLMMQEAK